MKAIDNCLIEWIVRIPGPNWNDQEGEQTQLVMLDQVRVLIKGCIFRATKKK